MSQSYQNHLVVEYAKTICAIDFFKELTGELTEEEQDCLNGVTKRTKEEVKEIEQ